MSQLNNSEVWKKLEAHHRAIAKTKIIDLFHDNPNRWQQFSLNAADLMLDYSKNLINEETLNLLCQLAEESKLSDHIEKMFTGAHIDYTEDRPVLHTALRAKETKTHLIVDGEDITQSVQDSLSKMDRLVTTIRNGEWRGYSGKAIKDIVNIGIGGSDLGPAMITDALTPYADKSLGYHFVSNVDSTHISRILENLNPETTLFIISSKKFLTPETLCNSNSARDWVLNHAPNKEKQDVVKHHFIAVTAKVERAIEFGISESNIYPFWDWVGGRFSLWSSIGLSVAIAIGMDNFKALLSGAEEMDKHFRTAPFRNNMPIILALISIWYVNFLGSASRAVIPYAQYLALLPAYLQQLEMESNGKRVSWDGKKIDYTTAPIIWGSVGTNGQHAFHQLLLQSETVVPVDFILALKTHHPLGNHFELLVANCFAQAQALMQGRTYEEIKKELLAEGKTIEEAEKLAPHKVVPGNHPSNMIILPELNPRTLGALLALYEHKVFVQGIIWRINSFDQWGVELGKKIANKIIPMLKGARENWDSLDPSTQNLIELYLKSQL